MANKWRGLSADTDLGKPLRRFIELIEKTNEVENQVLSAVRTALTVAQAFVIDISVDPLEEAIRALVDQITTLLDQLTQDTACHAIMIPIQKNYPGVIGVPSLDTFSYTPTFDNLLNNGSWGSQVIAGIPPATIDFINTAPDASGGNAGYWRTLYASVQDPGDVNRPRFNSTFAVSGIAIVYGSGKLDTLNRISAALYALFRFGIFSDMLSRTAPVAQNIRVLAVPVLEATGADNQNRIGVQIDWDPVPPIKVNSLYDNSANIIIDEIIIVRSTDASIRSTFNWHSVFPEEPSDTLTDLPVAGDTRVIARLRNDGFIRRYIDSSPDLHEDVTYYYAVALRSYSKESRTRTNPNPQKVRQPMAPFSAVRRVFYTRRANLTRQSTPPDWFAVPSLVRLFPVVEDIIGTAKLWVAGLLTRSTSNNGITQVLQQLIDQIERYLAQLQAVVDKMKQISQLLNVLRDSNLGAVTVTSFSVPTGGMDAWMAELARRLSDPSDPSRPPFDNDELVSGVVIVAGAPDFQQLTAFNTLKNIFFGGDKDNPMQRVIDILGDPPPTDAEAARDVVGGNTNLSPAASPVVIQFDPAFGATRAPASDPTPPADKFFDDNMSPTSTPNC